MAAAALIRPRTKPPLARGEAPFKRVLYANGGAPEAADQAAALAAPDGAVEKLASSDPARALLEGSPEHDLLCLAPDGFGRLSGIVLGDAMTEVVHRAAAPVLVARPLPPHRRLTDHLLLATDGSPGSAGAAELAARIAAARGSRVTVFIAGRRGSGEGIARQIAELVVATGVEPPVICEDVPAHRGIVDLAAREGATLVVVGSRGLGGIKALGSVSERVAHEAGCSVLVAR